MAKGRPGGNPNLTEHQFTTDRQEPLTEHLQLRITPSMKQWLGQVPDYKEFVRQAIIEKIANLSISQQVTK